MYVHFAQMTEVDIAILKYLARYSILNSILDRVMQPQFSYLLLLDWFRFVWGPADPTKKTHTLQKKLEELCRTNRYNW